MANALLYQTHTYVVHVYLYNGACVCNVTAQRGTEPGTIRIQKLYNFTSFKVGTQDVILEIKPEKT